MRRPRTHTTPPYTSRSSWRQSFLLLTFVFAFRSLLLTSTAVSAAASAAAAASASASADCATVGQWRVAVATIRGTVSASARARGRGRGGGLFDPGQQQPLSHRGGDGAALHLRSSGRIAPAGPPPTRALSVTAAFASHLRGQGGEGTYPLPVVFRQKKRRHFWDFFDGDLRRRLRRGQAVQ